MKQPLTRQLLTFADDARYAPIGMRQTPLLAALAAKLKHKFILLDMDVLVAKRGDAVAFILARVFVIADTDQRRFEQADDGGERFLALQPR